MRWLAIAQPISSTHVSRQVGDAEVSRVLECKGFHDYPHFNSLYFNTRLLPLRELPCYTLKMYLDLGFEKT